MASCDSLRQIFDKPLLETPTPIDSLSTWSSHNKPSELSSFTELFGEFHFKQSPESSSLPFLPAPLSSLLAIYSSDHENKNKSSALSFLGPRNKRAQERSCSKDKQIFSIMNSGSLHTCTEGLGFESFDDVDNDLGGVKRDNLMNKKEKVRILKHSSCGNLYGESRKFRSFPPPIPSIGRNGKLWVSYKSFRCDGRLVLKEVMIPTQGQEFIHACREDGRLTLHLVYRDEENHVDEDKVKDERGFNQDRDDHVDEEEAKNEGKLKQDDEAEEMEKQKGDINKDEVNGSSEQSGN